MSKSLLTVDDALALVLGSFQPLGSHAIILDECLNRVLAEEVIAATDLPPFPSSSMDGYAVRSVDIADASRETPIRLQVFGEMVAGGEELPAMGPGQAVRIMTGTPLAAGADTIVPIELTTQPGPMTGTSLPESIDVVEEVVRGAYIRKKGQDVRAGSKVFGLGHRIR